MARRTLALCVPALPLDPLIRGAPAPSRRCRRAPKRKVREKEAQLQKSTSSANEQTRGESEGASSDAVALTDLRQLRTIDETIAPYLAIEGFGEQPPAPKSERAFASKTARRSRALCPCKPLGDHRHRAPPQVLCPAASRAAWAWDAWRLRRLFFGFAVRFLVPCRRAREQPRFRPGRTPEAGRVGLARFGSLCARCGISATARSRAPPSRLAEPMRWQPLSGPQQVPDQLSRRLHLRL